MMNTRIKELADQAAVNDVAKNFNGEDYTVRMPSEEWAREFAELIVRECASIVTTPTIEAKPPYDVAVKELQNIFADGMMKHFGVE